jgi:RecB family endonuclease NucS
MAVTEEQRQTIRSLLGDGLTTLGDGLTTDEIAARMGLRPAQARAVKAHVTMGSYASDGTLPAEAESEIVEAFETKFGLERDLQLALRKNIGQLLPGGQIADGGRERSVPSGRIDIVARDESGSTVVIELKAGEADRDAVGQLLSYMGDLMEEGEQVRGVLVAHAFTSRATSAARSVPTIQLMQYRFQFTFERVSS